MMHSVIMLGVVHESASGSRSRHYADGLSYAYDALNRPVSRNADSFAYDAKARLTSAWRRPCGSADFEFVFSNVYDHLDRRVQKITPEATHYNSSTPNSSTRHGRT